MAEKENAICELKKLVTGARGITLEQLDAFNYSLKVIYNQEKLDEEIREEKDRLNEAKCYIQELEKKVEALKTNLKTKTVYKVVRTFSCGSYKEASDLEDAFAEGWEFVKASDYMPGRTDIGCFEYILKKEVEVKRNEICDDNRR